MASMIATDSARSARVFAALTKRWYWVVTAGVIGAVGAFALSLLITPLYTSNTTVFFSLRSAVSATDINQGSTYAQNQMLSFSQLATSSLVLDPVVAELGPPVTKESLRRSISVSSPQDTAVLTIKVSTTDPALSASMANSVASSLGVAVAKVSPGIGIQQSGIVANVIEPAVPATFQSSPDKKRNAVLGGIFGLAVSIFAIIIAVVLDTRVRSAATLKSMTDRPLLGTVEQLRANRDGRPITVRSPNSSAAERFRQIRMGMRFAAASHEMKVLAVTSAIPAEGKTLTALNLAIIMAEGKDRVLLIDADLRRPSVANLIGFEGAVGLTTVLVGDVEFEDAVQRFSTTTLDILTAGGVPPNPAELLGSAPMRLLIEEVKLKYDVIILDTAPVLAVADVAVMAQLVNSIVWVVDSRKLRRAQLDQASDALEATGTHVAGIILNRVKPLRIHDVYYREPQDEPAHSTRNHAYPVDVQDTTAAGSLHRNEQL